MWACACTGMRHGVDNLTATWCEGMADPYLAQLTARLIEGLQRQTELFRKRHGAYLRGLQNGDGGFSGREGGSDLYYTGFALRGLAVLDESTPEAIEQAAGYLRQSLRQQTSVVDFF